MLTTAGRGNVVGQPMGVCDVKLASGAATSDAWSDTARPFPRVRERGVSSRVVRDERREKGAPLVPLRARENGAREDTPRSNNMGRGGSGGGPGAPAGGGAVVPPASASVALSRAVRDRVSARRAGGGRHDLSHLVALAHLVARFFWGDSRGSRGSRGSRDSRDSRSRASPPSPSPSTGGRKAGDGREPRRRRPLRVRGIAETARAASGWRLSTTQRNSSRSRYSRDGARRIRVVALDHSA